ncbi:hypothetical protein V8G54_003936 [Vigna mungo]|uniref:Uncharacterized protein n=1 Tax=Vigna mungo TaxID=3915 RepID=A0AAQ3PCW6_VIGMU
MENLITHLYVPSPKNRNIQEIVESFVMASSRGKGSHDTIGGHGGRSCCQCTYSKLMDHTQENCYSLHGFLDNTANISKTEGFVQKFSNEEYQEYLGLNLWKIPCQHRAFQAHLIIFLVIYLWLFLFSILKQKQPNLFQEQHQSSDPEVCAPSSDTVEPLENSLNINFELYLDDLAIVLRKEIQSCTKYPISYSVTTKNLSMKHQTFLSSLPLMQLESQLRFKH